METRKVEIHITADVDVELTTDHVEADIHDALNDFLDPGYTGWTIDVFDGNESN